MVKNFAVKSAIVTSALFQMARLMANAIYWSENSHIQSERERYEQLMENYDNELADWLKQIKRWGMSPVVYQHSFDEAVEIHLSNLKRQMGGTNA